MLRLQEKLFIINQLPLFANLPAPDKKFIAGLSLIEEYKKGDIVYKDGSPPDALYCVITGRLKAYAAENDKIEVLEYFKRGRYFGIISILTGEPHSVTVQAVNDSIILKIPKEPFDKLLKRIPALAMHFSQMLLRRIKRKTRGPGRKVFESTIISVFGASGTDYVPDLGESLRAQTGKMVILLNINQKKASGSVTIDSSFFDESAVKAGILKDPRYTIDVLNISNRSRKPSHLIAVLSYLTSDYHYVLVDLRDEMDEFACEVMRQSDMAHILTLSDGKSLSATAGLISTLEKTSPDIGNKIRIITREGPVGGPALDFAERKAVLKHDIFAAFSAKADPGYERMVRRISRQIGDCLIGLALGSGAALGLAHVGVLKVIEREKIPIDIMAGTSMGALIGALWASGKDTEEIEEILLRFKRKIATWRLVDLTWPAKGFIKGREVRRFLVSQFKDKTFHDLRLPFKIVACDLERREEVVLEEGGLVDAVMASIAIPGIFQPVKIGNRILVDGGIIDPVPSAVLMRLGVSKVIAVNTLASPEDVRRSDRKVSNIFDFMVNSIEASEYLLAEMNCQNADVAMHPILPSADWYEFYKAPEIIKRGEEEALKHLSQLKELAAAK